MVLAIVSPLVWVRETIYDRTDLSGGVAPFSGGNSGGWSVGYSWYYTGGFPYGWTTYTTCQPNPGSSGQSATGTFVHNQPTVSGGICVVVQALVRKCVGALPTAP